MPATNKALRAAFGVLALLLPLAACSVDVRDRRSGRNADVDIRTPVGHVSVRGDVDVRDTGLPVYPYATRLRDRNDRNGANVDVGNSWFGVKVVAATFESDDAAERVLDFYRREMRAYGRVTECRGNVKFRGKSGARQPVCREAWSESSEMKLYTGPEDHMRVVAVKPRGEGSEFSVVYVVTGN